jgi:hypothetical protein
MNKIVEIINNLKIAMMMMLPGQNIIYFVEKTGLGG